MLGPWIAATNEREIFPLQKHLSEVSSITDICIYLTLAMKYHFYCMRCCSRDVILMFVGYLQLIPSDICKKVVYIDIKNTILHVL